MKVKQMKRVLWMIFAGLALCFGAEAAFAVSGIGSIATNVTGNFGAITRLITGASYVAGFAFAVGAVVKFKAHKDNPTQIPISQPIALLFVGAALIFIPAVFKTTGATLFNTGISGVNKVSGVSTF